MVNVDCSFLHQSKWVLLHLIRQAQDKQQFAKLTLQYEMTDKVYKPNNCKCI
jgi:hypothetical protein